MHNMCITTSPFTPLPTSVRFTKRDPGSLCRAQQPGGNTTNIQFFSVALYPLRSPTHTPDTQTLIKTTFSWESLFLKVNFLFQVHPIIINILILIMMNRKHFPRSTTHPLAQARWTKPAVQVQGSGFRGKCMGYANGICILNKNHNYFR